jgi:hypothetical protein
MKIVSRKYKLASCYFSVEIRVLILYIQISLKAEKSILRLKLRLSSHFWG